MNNQLFYHLKSFKNLTLIISDIVISLLCLDWAARIVLYRTDLIYCLTIVPVYIFS
jgi:hypothetical protein